jgi:two-component system response regulator VicR
MAHKILVVEDNESLCNVLADTFTDEGFEVKTALDGEAGLEAAKEWGPDVMLLDLLLPKKDGEDLLKELREEEGGDSVAVIALTNSDSSEKVYNLMNLGVTDYLTKSDWELSDLVEKVKEKLTSE